MRQVSVKNRLHLEQVNDQMSFSKTFTIDRGGERFECVTIDIFGGINKRQRKTKGEDGHFSMRHEIAYQSAINYYIRRAAEVRDRWEGVVLAEISDCVVWQTFPDHCECQPIDIDDYEAYGMGVPLETVKSHAMAKNQFRDIMTFGYPIIEGFYICCIPGELLGED